MTQLADVDELVRLETDKLNGGFLQLYDGKTLLVQMRFADPAFLPVHDGLARAHPLNIGTARADGIATTYVAMTADDKPVLAGFVGVEEKLPDGSIVEEAMISQRYIAAGAEVRVTNFTYRQESE